MHHHHALVVMEGCEVGPAEMDEEEREGESGQV